MLLKSGTLFKLGDGPINYDWNSRYCVLDFTAQELTYFANDQETTARGTIYLGDALLSNITLIKEREHSFSLQTAPQPSGKTYFFSFNSEEESVDWQQALIQASGRSKINQAQASFKRKQITQSAAKSFMLSNRKNNEWNETEEFNDESIFVNMKEIKARHHQSIGGILQGKPSMNKSIIMKPLRPAIDTHSEDESVDINEDTRETRKADEIIRNMGSEVSTEMINLLNRVQNIVSQDMGVIDNTKDIWQTIHFSNGTVLQALNPQKSNLKIDPKAIKALIKTMIIISFAFYFIGEYVANFIIGFTLWFMLYKMFKTILVLQQKYIKLKLRTLVNGNPDSIGKYILDSMNQQSSDNLDIFKVQSHLISKDEGKHLFNNEETYDLPSNWLIRSFIPSMKVQVQTYWCSETQSNGQQGAFYVLRKFKTPKNKQDNTSNEESFVIIPIAKSSKCFVYCISDFSIMGNSVVSDQIKLERLTNMMGKLGQYEDDNAESDCESTQEIQIHQSRLDYLADSWLKETINQGGQAGQMRHNIYVAHGQRLNISHRFPGYFRLENGLLWCSNQDELNSQSGIFSDLMKKAGKQLMEGKSIVQVSLPVKMFDKRSAVERICDLWCTFPQFMKDSSMEVLDPLERMKYAITAVISGMHQIANSQRKPFNPILGETFTGLYPNGSKVYVEHISHNPPISSYLYEDTDNRYSVNGSLEYSAKVTDSGNSMIGKLIGKNMIVFQNDQQQKIEFQYPSLRISGLLYGKRTVQWIGSFQFTDNKNGLKAIIEFSGEKGFFSRQQTLPLDCFEGAITKNNVQVQKIQGSWLEFLRFNDKLYWELETCDTVRPTSIITHMLSDCTYREDLQQFISGDIERAQKEKERLEEQQRYDRNLREEAKERRKTK